MSPSPGVSPTDDTVKNQAMAANPDFSIWVSANAGSGKTHILTLRVLRLLLSGVAPENILCLTYTKAAAAEMKIRVAKSLSGWTLLNNEDLKNSLKEISGRLPNTEQMIRARTLFALALETPGGLKISTIHAFCEAALHRFPLEADVPVNFSVIEDTERAHLIQTATEKVLATGLSGNQEAGDSVANLFSLMSDNSIYVAIKSALGQSMKLREILKSPGKANKNLRRLVGYDPARTLDILNKEIVSNCQLTACVCQELIEAMNGDPLKTKGLRFVDLLARMDHSNWSREELISAFVTKEGNPRASLVTKPIQKKHPHLLAPFEKERERVFALFCEIRATALVLRSESLLQVVAAIQSLYEDKKSASDRLDFDDLIVKFEGLLSGKTSSDWVRYKLDAGMTHILVDESQDTNPDQWRVIKLLVEDFFVGEGAAQANRTIFGVGDEKQSIYGFQGAEPKLFGETGAALKHQANQSDNNWENVRFSASFRTQQNILFGVDKICQRADIAQALLAHPDPVEHESARTDKGGSITLWPPLNEEKSDKSQSAGAEWLENPPPPFRSSVRLNAERIVSQIEFWIKTRRPLGARKRAVCANDILILVQTRSPIFHEIVRALKLKNIPTPGADRLLVTEHVLVHDLLALGDILLNPGDDLTLASVLRSPLFDVSLDQLELICMNRKPDVRVWQALEEAAETIDWAKSAFDRLSTMAKTLDRERPYEFFAELLYSHEGLKKFHLRLGEEIDEVAEAFLDLALEHEQSSQPSLQGFLAEMRAQDIEIKRELSEGGNGVRVMTVHGAKGLEAPIVIIADGNKKPSLKQSVFMESGDKPCFVHASKALDHTRETLERFRDPAKEKEGQEYWRKLYVAMTRAEDELYITGAEPLSSTDLQSSNPQPSWYGAIEEALGDEMIEVDIAGETEKGLRYPKKIPASENIEPDVVSTPQPHITAAPAPLQELHPIITIRPSTAFEDDLTAQNTTQNHGGHDAEIARKRGTTLHDLLEYLVPIAANKRKEAALHALKKLHANEPESHEDLSNKVLSILSGKDAKFLFGENSRAELPIFVFGEKNHKPVQIIGRIDRLIVENHKITLVDFKSNAVPPLEQTQLSAAYQTQMGLYLRCGEKLFPNYQICTAIYWTGNENLMALDNDLLLKATGQFKIT